jgi:hypothetical protein
MKKIAGLIRGMGEWTDLDKALQAAGLTAAEALAALEAREGQRQMAARRELAKIHAEVIALRFRPLAASKLCGMLQEEKLDVRMKAALAVLGMTSETASLTKRASEEAAEGSDEGEEADTELMMAVAEVLAERRRAELMGAPPRMTEEKADEPSARV